jgi:hypothetical protein
MTPQQRKDLIIRIGKALYGERYGAPLARLIGVDQSLIARIVADNPDRVATDLVMQQLAIGLGREWQRRLASLHEIEGFVRQVTGHSIETQIQLMRDNEIDGPAPQNQ